MESSWQLHNSHRDQLSLAWVFDFRLQQWRDENRSFPCHPKSLVADNSLTYERQTGFQTNLKVPPRVVSWNLVRSSFSVRPPAGVRMRTCSLKAWVYIHLVFWEKSAFVDAESRVGMRWREPSRNNNHYYILALLVFNCSDRRSFSVGGDSDMVWLWSSNNKRTLLNIISHARISITSLSMLDKSSHPCLLQRHANRWGVCHMHIQRNGKDKGKSTHHEGLFY